LFKHTKYNQLNLTKVSPIKDNLRTILNVWGRMSNKNIKKLRNRIILPIVFIEKTLLS